jgi:hypothetical protein
MRSHLLLALLILIKFILQYLVIHPSYELHRDEFLHLDQAHHLAWGYASVPPATSWISWIILQLGNGEFWVKFFPALFGALTLLVVWKTVEALGGGLFARALAGIAVLFSALARINMLYQPNSLDVLCWTLLLYLLIRYIQTQKTSLLYACALVFALGFLNKYNIIFLVVALVPALLISSRREIFARPALYGAALLAILLIAPNIYWQWSNDWPVYQHMEELSKTQLVHVDRMNFVKEQFLFYLGSLFVWMAGLVALLIYKPWKPYHFLFATFFFCMALFIYLKAKPYYAIGLYPIYLALGAAWLEKVFAQGWKQKLRYAAIAIPIILFIPMLLIAFPLKDPHALVAAGENQPSFGQHRWEDGKEYPISQDFADMLGWKELATKVGAVLGQSPTPDSVLIFCDNYGLAGAVNYYGHLPNRAHSFSADYLNWVDTTREYRDLLWIIEADNNSLAEISSYFENTIVADSITTPFAREKGTRIVWLQKSRGSLREFLAAEVRKR